VGGWALSQRDHVRNDAAPVRESVLDQKTLKEPIHSRDRECTTTLPLCQL
jgi:hypothetical protein